MTNEELVAHLKDLGLRIEILEPVPGVRFIVARDFLIAHGPLHGQRHDVGIPWQPLLPYVAPSSIHVKPHAVPMGQRNSQASQLGPDWQYLSRVLRGQPSPAAWVVHVNTVLSEL